LENRRGEERRGEERREEKRREEKRREEKRPAAGAHRLERGRQAPHQISSLHSEDAGGKKAVWTEE
jgi:hypothetical protein